MLSQVGQATAAILVTSTLAACTAGNVKPTDAKDIETLMGKGFQCFLVPSEYYKPGTVFRIDEHKVAYLANRALADKVQSSAKDAAFGVLAGKQHVNLDVLVTLLNLKAPGQNLASVGASADRTRRIDAKLTGLKLEIADDADVDQVVSWFSSYPNKRPKSRYYVVREAYLADSMGPKITKELMATQQLWTTFALMGQILTAAQRQHAFEQYMDTVRHTAVLPERRDRSCPRVLRQPVSSWPRKTNQKSHTGSVTIKLEQV